MERGSLAGGQAFLNHSTEATLAIGKHLQALRALELLEWIGTAEARDTVARLAQGAPGARSTAEAKAALRRMSLQ